MIHIPLEGISPFLIPSPHLRRDIIMDNNSLGFGKLRHFHVKATVIHEDQCVRLKFKNVFFDGGKGPQHLPKTHDHFHKSHDSEFIIMDSRRQPLLLHIVATHSPKLCLRIKLLQGMHQVGCMEISGSFAGDEVVFHGWLVI